MRFFSNDKDARDDQQGVDVQERADELNPEQAHDDRGDAPEHVQSDPVPVPQQRSGSPWSSPDAPGGSPQPVGAHAVDPDRLDDAPNGPASTDNVTAETATTETGTDGPPPFHEPGPQPTAFGAGTVGGAVAASATANPQNDQWDTRTPVTDADSGVADDRSVAPGDGAVDDRVETPAHDAPAHDAPAHDAPADYTPADDAAADDAPAGDALDGDKPGPVAVDRRPDGEAVDVALDDRGTFDDPQVRDETGREDTTPPDHAAADTAPDAVASAYAESRDTDDTSDSVTGPDAALRDEGGFDDPKAVEPGTEQPLEAAGAGAAAGGVAAAAATADGDRKPGGESKPGAVSAPSLAKLFGDDAGSFRERWRDVQLRFVDSPKEATAEAAGLVDEVVDKLASSLKAQRASLAGEGSADDTEKLRVELRSYRDFLNRLLDL